MAKKKEEGSLDDLKFQLFWEGRKNLAHFPLVLTLLSSKVINVGSDTFGNPIFQKVLQN